MINLEKFIITLYHTNTLINLERAVITVENKEEPVGKPGRSSQQELRRAAWQEERARRLHSRTHGSGETSRNKSGGGGAAS